MSQSPEQLAGGYIVSQHGGDGLLGHEPHWLRLYSWRVGRGDQEKDQEKCVGDNFNQMLWQSEDIRGRKSLAPSIFKVEPIFDH